MLDGFWGKLLWVDLSSGTMLEDDLPAAEVADFIGGYGIGARLLYERLPRGLDALGPENVLGFFTGPLTGTPVPTATRLTVVAKSPLTGGWGDSSLSGFFGPALRAGGYDGVLFTGVSPRPVYFLLVDGRAELRDAGALWGQDSYAVDDWATRQFGPEAAALCIGPAGEAMSLISGIVHAKGRVAARSGLGAVMGSKRLKAVVVRGSQAAQVADPGRVRELKRKYGLQINRGTGAAEFLRTTGTPGYNLTGALNGDSPIRNFAGVAEQDFADPKPIGAPALFALGRSRRACWHCPIACWGEVKTTFQGRPVQAHVPEYETTAAFAGNLLNNDLASIVAVNEICNRHGLDSISTGVVVGFALECFEHGLITEREAGGLDLRWGNASAIVALTEQIARRQGLGAVLADGVKRAAEAIGRGSEAFAMHVGGQELAMHDARFDPGLGLVYLADATPGRHSQANQFAAVPGWDIGLPPFDPQKPVQAGRGRYLKPLAALGHVASASGLCLFGYNSTTVEFLSECLSAVLGRAYALSDLLLVGERIANVRQAFNIRQGYRVQQTAWPARAFGHPPLAAGPLAGVRVEVDALLREHLQEMDWGLEDGIPSAARLIALGLDDIAADLHGGP